MVLSPIITGRHKMLMSKSADTRWKIIHQWPKNQPNRLDHPEEMWRNMYRYYRRRMAPKVDVRLVIAITITIISAVQV